MGVAGGEDGDPGSEGTQGRGGGGVCPVMIASIILCRWHLQRGEEQE